MRSSNHPRFLLASLLASVLLQPCAFAYGDDGVAVTELPVWVNYQCAKNRSFSVDRSQAPRMAKVMIKEKVIALPGGQSAAQEKYSDGDYILYLDGENAMLEHLGMVLFGPCKSASSLPVRERELAPR